MKPANASTPVGGGKLPKVDKIVIAIHGVGDQYRYATVQSVLNRLGHFCSYPATIPLGAFHSAGSTQAFVLTDPVPTGSLQTVGFKEAYWADIPRRVQKEGYTLEESKAWARTVVRRVRARFGEIAGGLRQKDYELAATVIEEMIETIRVLENLLFILEKLFKFKFDLDDLLTAYLGDVQIVTEFEEYRRSILDAFNQVVCEACQGNEEAELFIVAHSEGTVIAFMGLLEAMSAGAAKSVPSWVDQLHGFMTIGSPIDKHLILWPKLWDKYQTRAWQPSLQRIARSKLTGRDPAAIPWYNYFDFGDPIGFELETARDWLTKDGWPGAFDFPKAHDFGFSRYWFPGKAHNDYWSDPYVFGHFLQNVVKLTPPPAPPGVTPPDYSKPPPDVPAVGVVSYVFPFLICAGLIATGVFFLHHAVISWTRQQEGTVAFCRNVAGITSLLFGVTALARIIRLTRRQKWFGWAFLIFCLGAVGYVVLVSDQLRRSLSFCKPSAEILPDRCLDGPTWLIVGTALVIAIGSGIASRRWPRLGMIPLLLPAGLIIAAIVISRLLS